MTNLDGEENIITYPFLKRINELTRINQELRLELVRVQGLLDELKKKVANGAA